MIPGLLVTVGVPVVSALGGLIACLVGAGSQIAPVIAAIDEVEIGLG